MDITTIVGLIAGFTLVTMGMLSGGQLSGFVDVPSLLITVGGTLAAFLVASTLTEATRFLGWIGYVFYFPQKYYAKVHPEMFEETGSRRPEPATDEELAQLRFDLARGAEILRRLRPYPIGIGVVGTFVGIINMLHNLDDPAWIGPGIATALITVFYGIVITYLIVIPMSQKLEARLRSLDEAFWR